jgi:phosphate transport system substrate-binding protein
MVFIEVTGHTRIFKLKKRMRMNLSKQYFILILLLSTLLWAGCHHVKNVIPESIVSGSAVIAADEALRPLMNAELDIFHSLYNYAFVDCKYVSEYDAINLLLQEKIRLAIVSRPLNQKEIDFLKEKKLLPESIPLAYDAIALITHPGNKIKTLSIGQISQILSGSISDWNQLDNSGKSGNIEIIFDSESSGVIRYLNDKLNLNKKLSGFIKFAGSSRNVIDMVAADPNGIGFVGYNWISETDNLNVQETLTKLNLIAVSSVNTNSYLPSISSIFNNTYPLIRKIYAIYTDPGASLARGFLAHLTCERGQKIIYRCGLKPEKDFQRLVKINIDY